MYMKAIVDVKNIFKLVFTVALNETNRLNNYQMPTKCENAMPRRNFREPLLVEG
jgi:hypothetical protein